MPRLCALLIVLVAAAPAAAAAVPNDPGFGDQWALHVIGAAQAWDSSRGSGAVVAVVDTGADLDHEDLKGNLVGGKNFVEEDEPPQDDDGHGTHVSGIAGAASGNGAGVAGVAPATRLMPLRVLQHERDPVTGGQGSAADVEAAIRWAADNGADVINLSLGEDVVIRNVAGSSIGDAVEYAWSKGSIPVIAAGNDSLRQIAFPSGYGDIHALVVSATNRQDRKPNYSNGVGSARWGLAAPGGERGDPEECITDTEILSAFWEENSDDAYACLFGTSMSAPHVAGAAALLRALDVPQQQTVDVLLETAKDLGASGEDSTYGHGRLDVAAAVAAVTGGSGGSSEPPPEPTATNGPASRAPGGELTTNLPGGDDGSPRRSTNDPSPSDRNGSPNPSSSATPEGDRVAGAQADRSDGGPSPVAAPPTSEGGGLLLPVAGILGALALSAGGLFLWLRRGGP